MSISTYSEFQALAKSEKIGLVQLEAAKRLMGWVLESGSIYKLTSFDYAVITAIEDSGTAYTAVTALADVTAGKYFNDRDNQILYLRASDSSNPNSRFLAMTFRMFFANAAVIAPHDLASGFDVEWLPLLKSTSEFGVGLDNANQLGVAIEGTGSVSFHNDQEYWGPKFDKWTFENQRVFIYSWYRELPTSEAKIVYRGRIQSKKWSDSQVGFTLKDYLNELRAPVPISDMDDVAGARLTDAMRLAKQRLAFGYVSGHRPTPIDMVLTGYPITGTLSATNASATVTGSGTQFLKELTAGDQVYLGSDSAAVIVGTVDSDTQFTASQAYTGSSQSGVSATVKPSHPKRWMNREFLLAGHSLREPTTTVTAAQGTTLIKLGSTLDLLPGDSLVVGTETTTILRISDTWVKLATSLSVTPAVGTAVTRLSVSSVYLNDRLLEYDRDYTYDATNATLTLDELAEYNAAPVLKLSGTSVAFTSASRAIVGTATFFKTDLLPGDWIAGAGYSDYYEVLSVEDDTHATLRAVAGYTATVPALVRKPAVYDEGRVILTCDILGATVDGTTSGALLKTAPQIVKDLLTRAGLSSSINTASFTSAESITEARLGLVIPDKLADTKVPTLRDVISRINKSVFASLTQNADFELEFSVLSPKRPSTLTQMREVDVIKFSIEASSDLISKTAKVNYLVKEYDPFSAGPLKSVISATSNVAQYLAKTTKETTIDTLLVSETDATIYARRWAFLLSVATAIVKIDTKLQGARLSVNDRLELFHEKLYERVGSPYTRKIAAVSAAKKSITGASIEADDLANSLSRCGVITENTADSYSEATEGERIRNGYITDSYGMQSNDPDTFGVSLIW